MKRRTFLQLSALGGATVSAGGCATAGGSPLGTSARPNFAEEVRAFSARFDQLMEGLPNVRSLGELFVDGTRSAPASVLDTVVQGGSALAAQASLAMTSVGLLRDLPAEAIGDDDVQARIASVAPDIEGATEGMLRLLEDTSAEQLRGVQQRLVDEPDLGLRLAEGFSSQAADLGVPYKRRLHLRALILECATRLRSHPSGVVDEVIATAHKVMMRTRSASAEDEAPAAPDDSKVPEPLPEPESARAAEQADPPASTTSARPASPTAAPSRPEMRCPEKSHWVAEEGVCEFDDTFCPPRSKWSAEEEACLPDVRGSREAATGSITALDVSAWTAGAGLAMMGLAAGVGGVGVVFGIGAAGIGPAALTLGVLLLILGLVVLAVGGLIYLTKVM